jgi:hypothetical protein
MGTRPVAPMLLVVVEDAGDGHDAWVLQSGVARLALSLLVPLQEGPEGAKRAGETDLSPTQQ